MSQRHWSILPTSEIFDLVKQASQPWSLPPLQQWLDEVQLCYSTFLQRVKAEVIDTLSLQLPSVYISYVVPTSVKPQQLPITRVAQLLHDIFSLLGFPSITAEPLPPVTDFHERLSSHTIAVILCTPEYAEAVVKEPKLREEIAAFGKRRKDALHTLLCEGGFTDTGSKVIDKSTFLARFFQSVVKVDVVDPLVSLLRFLDVFCLLSGSQGLGILPDLMDLELSENYVARDLYQIVEDDLQKAEHSITIDYRLQAALLRGYHSNPLVRFTNSKGIPDTKQVVVDLLGSPNAKTSLLLCPTSVDTALMGLALEREFIGHSWRCISVDCARYPGVASYQCVSEKLLEIGIKAHSDILSVRNYPVVLLFMGYDAIGTYDNLYVKNDLNLWPDVKVIVTCRLDVFQHRSHTSSFLPDPTVPLIEALRTSYIPAFAPPEAAQEYSTTITKKQQTTIHSGAVISAKRRAQHAELTGFLLRLNSLLVAEGVLRKDLSHNPRIFISYAWEPKDQLASQQKLLRQLVVDLQTLGYPTWLDIERMTGDIDQQMAGNIATSAFALVIGTPLYCKRAEEDTNVRKEYQAILEKEKDKARPLQPLPVLFGENGTLPLALQNHCNVVSLSNLLQFDIYTNFLVQQLIPRLLSYVPATSQDKVNNLVSLLDDQLRLLPGKHLIVEHNQDMLQSHDMDNRLEGHIATFGLATSKSPLEARYKLEDRLKQFLSSSKKTCVVFGGAGTGKSLFALSTFRTLLRRWHNYRKDMSLPLPPWLPLYIPLKRFAQEATSGFVSSAFRAYELEERDVQALRDGLGRNQRLLFILDGYDELGRGMFPNLPQMLGEWHNAKVLITSRPEHFDNEMQYMASFAICKGTTTELDLSSFETHFVSPFTPTEIWHYIYYHSGEISPEAAYALIQSLPGLMELLANPFLLNLTLQSLEILWQKVREQTTLKRVTKTAVYQAFSEYWFGKEAYKHGILEHECKLFSQELAMALFASKTIRVSPKDHSLWLEFFGENRAVVQNTCPLRRSEAEYSFIHKSLLEFYTASLLWDSLSTGTATQQWSKRMLTEERAIINFLVEMYQQQSASVCSISQFCSLTVYQHAQLLQLVYSSRGSIDSASPLAAANAITVLNAAGFSFSGLDLSGVCIPGADLQGAVMHHTLLRGADLRGVLLSHGFLLSANLSGCNIADLSFGERPMLQHEQAVRVVAYSSNNKLLAAVSGSYIRCWSMETFQLVQTIKAYAHAISFSPDSTTLACASGNLVELWNCNPWHKRTLRGCADTIYSVAFSPDSSMVASGSKDGLVTVWDLNLRQNRSLKGHSIPVNDVVFMAGNNLISVDDYTVILWDLETNNHRTLHVHSSPILSTALSKDGCTLAFGTRTCTVDLIDIPTGVQHSLRGHNSAVTCVAFSPDCRRLASGSNDNTVKLWDLASTSHYTLPGHRDMVNSVAFSPNGFVLASGSKDNTVKLRDLANENYQALQGHSASVTGMAFSPYGKLVSGGDDNMVMVWDFVTGKNQIIYSHTAAVIAVAFSPNGSKIASGSHDCSAIVWDLNDGRNYTLGDSEAPVTSVAFSPNGKEVAFCSGERLHLCEVPTSTASAQWENCKSAAFSPDGKTLACATEKGVKIVDVNKQTSEVCQLQGYVGVGSASVAFSPSGSMVAAAGKAMRVWDWKTGTSVIDLVNKVPPYMVAFSPDSSWLAIGGKELRLVELTTKTHCFPSGHNKQVRAVAFSHDGKLATGGDDNTVKLWERRNYEWLVTFTAPKSLVASECVMEDVRGLSLANWQLLKQLGAKVSTNPPN